MENAGNLNEAKSCSGQYILAIKDTLNVITGKWKLPIIASLLYGNKRFGELQRDIPKISPRMLSKELRDLEMNAIVIRTVYDTIPVKVEYELTESAKTIHDVLDKMVEWGLQHRKFVFSK